MTRVSPLRRLGSVARAEALGGRAARRVAISGAAALLAGGGAYGVSALVAIASCETGACPIGSAPWPLLLTAAGVASWAAWEGSRDVT
ncbi:MAG: hypothetical protein IT376_05270 [Polyangiaceae bacterium]|nr:hypothetical protein [Polyangiaceae bacterium]